MHSSTQQNLAVLRSRHRAQELSAVLAEKRSSTMLALTRQTIDDLIKQPPQHPHEMDTWFSRLAESFSRLTACEPPYPFQQANLAYKLVRKHPLPSGLQLMVWAVKLARVDQLDQMIDSELVSFLNETVEGSEGICCDCAALALAELAARQECYRNFVLFNRSFNIVEAKVQLGQLSVDFQSRLFQELMKYPFGTGSQDEATHLIKKHLSLLTNNSTSSVCSVLIGLCNSLLWQQKWVVILLEERGIYSLLEKTSTRELSDEEICWMMHLLYLVGSNSSKDWKPMEETLVRFCGVFVRVFQINRQGDIQKAQHFALLILQHVFSDTTLSRQLSKAIKKGLLEELVRFVVDGYNASESANVIEVIYNMLSCVDLEEIAEEIIKAQLVGCLNDRLVAYQLFPKEHLMVMLEVLHMLADEPRLSQYLGKQGVRPSLEELRMKYTDFDLQESIAELLSRLDSY